jgi:hypothetical protein
MTLLHHDAVTNRWESPQGSTSGGRDAVSTRTTSDRHGLVSEGEPPRKLLSVRWNREVDSAVLLQRFYVRPFVFMATAGVGLIILVGCGREVTVAPPDPTSAIGCAVLFESLPSELGEERRLTVTPETEQTAAWGAPPLIWRCGVAAPTAFGTGSQLVEVNGTDWFPEELSDGVRFTSVEAQPNIEITVPSVYPAPASVLGAFKVAQTGNS